tara:strand:- start:390 stop:734 length:345 start_codon:yes stop_codon:yes gene_type:complete
MEKQIQTLIAKMKADYIRFAEAGGRGPVDPDSYFGKSIANFEDNITVKTGNKYVKIIKENSVWGFIVNTDNDKKFKKGDILKAAGWNAPARNAARGNILEGGYTVQWTGPLYLN